MSSRGFKLAAAPPPADLVALLRPLREAARTLPRSELPALLGALAQLQALGFTGGLR